LAVPTTNAPHFFDAHQIKRQPERVTRPHEFKTSVACPKDHRQEDGAGISDAVACPKCDVRMSRRIVKKPDIDTGLIEEVYRCPICGVVATRWVDQ
jgi:hypothetical protein